MNNHCRISKVRFKDGRTLDILPPAPIINNGLLIDAAKIVRAVHNLEGYLIIGWDDTATYRYSYDLGDMRTITPGLMPAWIHDILLREVTKNDLTYQDDTGEGA